jgi:DNA modification methylase
MLRTLAALYILAKFAQFWCISMKNRLFYGDNLDILRRYVEDESVDLVYLDPPFNSNADYNVLFKEKDGSKSAAQLQAFGDTWEWKEESSKSYFEVVESGNHRVSKALQALRAILGDSDMLAYASMMAPRLIELRRVLKKTGSLYLHCDPKASHYLKILLDSVFGPEKFQNEIISQRTISKALMTRRLPTNHDVILSFRAGDQCTWNLTETFIPYEMENLGAKTASKYSHRDSDGRLDQLDNLINPNPNRPNLTYEFLGITKVWRWTRERMQAAYDAGMVVQPSPGAVPRFKRYLDKQRGRPIGDVWADIPPLNSQAKERTQYQTQKPEALLERIIKLISNEGDIVLDPFCGCGTAIAAAEKCGRRWIGIDITQAAIVVIKQRLQGLGKIDYVVTGEPTSLADAQELAAQDPYQFQWWSLGLVGARPAEQKKGADKGIDGRLLFRDGHDETKEIIFSVKAGKLHAGYVRDFAA